MDSNSVGYEDHWNPLLRGRSVDHHHYSGPQLCLLAAHSSQTAPAFQARQTKEPKYSLPRMNGRIAIRDTSAAKQRPHLFMKNHKRHGNTGSAPCGQILHISKSMCKPPERLQKLSFLEVRERRSLMYSGLNVSTRNLALQS